MRIPESQPPPPQLESQSPSMVVSSFPAPVTPSPPSQEEIQTRSKNREEIRRVHDCYKRLKSCIGQRDGGGRSENLEQAYRSLISASRETRLLDIAATYKSSRGQTVDKSLDAKIQVRKASKRTFVSAFCQSNCGDVSPNTLGTWCIDTGLPCDFNHSTCNGKNELCYGRGPGYPDEFESTRIIGEKQFKMAVELFNKATEKLQGKIGYQHAYIDFSNLEVTVPKAGGGSETVKTCPAAMGFGFAAGTTDGPQQMQTRFRQCQTPSSQRISLYQSFFLLERYFH